MAGTPNEAYLEAYIEKYLTSQPIRTLEGNAIDRMEYHSVSPDLYDKDKCLIPSEVIEFLKDSQPKTYEKFVKDCGGEQNAQRSLFARLDTELKRGTLNVLARNSKLEAGYGAKFNMVYYRPANLMNADHNLNYSKNRLAIVRQLRYSQKNENSIDTVIFLNGLPIVTIELKNTLTGQKHTNAIRQYMEDRPIEGEKLLEFKRCLVHFAVGTEQAFMTTRLAGKKTRFFPFNMCYANEQIKTDGYKVSYLWEDVLRRDSLLDLIGNFVTLVTSEEKEYNEKKREIDVKKNTALIFPRYHQRRAVRKLVADLQERGVGHKYLIQHSAGSGKSNTIAWLAYKLSNLYRYPTDTATLFDSILIVTDRRVLDRQLQANFKNFEVTEGEVKYIDKNCTSQDLKTAIEERRKIIITTLQKFPVIADAITLYPDRKYAVIIDEAHSSQSGESARDMRKALSLEEAERFQSEIESELDDIDILNAKIEAEIERKGNKSNISFFAFTATPKDKTIELFCEREYGTKEPFDVYSMEEAIKEGFIRDVLENYMSFKRYYKLVKKEQATDKEYDKKKALALLGGFADSQMEAIKIRARIMIEHFASQTSKEIQGKARAMVVTRSRLHAVRFKLAFDEIMAEMKLPYGALVAFSGTVIDPETKTEYTENSMNNIAHGVDIPDALKLPQFRILIVAEKYQTGFDEPLLHTMFVDKKLGGTSTVQTLSRLNRTRSDKNSTMVLDFVNDPELIKADFQKYYGKNFMYEEDETDPNSLYDVKSKVLAYNAVSQQDIDDFAKIYFQDGEDDKQKVYGVLYRVSDRAKAQLDSEDLVLFRKACQQFVKLYKFLSQIITFVDAELEKLYVFLSALIKALPYEPNKLPYEILAEAQLDSYRIKYQFTQKLELESGDSTMEGLRPGDGVTREEPEMEYLTKIIKQLNDLFGVELTDDDKLDLDRMRANLSENSELTQYFNSDNTRESIKEKFDEELDAEIMNFVNSKFRLYEKLTEQRANAMLKTLWFNELYTRMMHAEQSTYKVREPEYRMVAEPSAHYGSHE